MEAVSDLKWWQSAFTWYAIILIILVVVISIKFTMAETRPNGPILDTWYTNLAKPPGVPPNWAFGLIWGVLYIFLVVGVIIAAWDYNKPSSSVIICFYTVILLLTAFWCYAFFSLHDMSMGIVILVILLIITGITIWLLYPTTLAASDGSEWWTYLPFAFYIAFFVWICFATYFNVGIASRNK